MLPSVKSSGGGGDHADDGSFASWLYNKIRHVRICLLRLKNCLKFVTFDVPSLVFYRVLSPVLNLFAWGLVGLWALTFYGILIPMLSEKYYNNDSHASGDDNGSSGGSQFFMIYVFIHFVFGTFVWTNVIYNYFYCIKTKHSTHYDTVARQIASVTDFEYPETHEELVKFKTQLEAKLEEQKQQQKKDQDDEEMQPLNEEENISSNDTKQDENKSSSSTCLNFKNEYRQWQLLEPYEWGYCYQTDQPKPPRAHYDHVTKQIVLCFDHYCPWMCNAVGYFNYRYFVNFICYVSIGSIYLTILLDEPSQLLSSDKYVKQIRYNLNEKMSSVANFENYDPVRIHDMVPHKDEKMFIEISSRIFLAVSLGVTIMAIMHLFLIFTAQTTIEFQANNYKRWAGWFRYFWERFFFPSITAENNAKKKKKCTNAYSLGWKRNWQQVYGTKNVFLAMLPSNREPEFLPIPITGNRGKRSFTVSPPKPVELNNDNV